MDSGSTRLRLVETANRWELREPGRERPLNTAGTRVQGLRAGRAMLEFGRGGQIEVIGADGIAEMVEIAPLPRQQRGRLGRPSRLNNTLAVLWLVMFVTVFSLVLTDEGPVRWRQILQIVLGGALAVVYAAMVIRSVRHRRRPFTPAATQHDDQAQPDS